MQPAGPGPNPRRTGQLAGVSAYIGCVRQADLQSSLLEAFGGGVAQSPEDATHVLVPDDLTAVNMRSYQECLWKSLVLGKPIVAVSWLGAVVSDADSSPWDQSLVDRYVPACLADFAPDVLGLDPVVPRPSPYAAGASARPRPEAISSSPLNGGRPNAVASSRSPVNGSLQETWEFLRREHPDEVEAGQLRMAIELSLLDCAIALQPKTARPFGATAAVPNPEKVLGVNRSASRDEIRAAYRRRARALHPDKGGDATAFNMLQQAYMMLNNQLAPLKRAASASAKPMLALPWNGTSSRDFELREHRTLVESWFEQHGASLDQNVRKMERAVSSLHLELCDVGSVSLNERGELMHNQCFYLSIARSYLGAGYSKATVQETALFFKRVIEAAVLASHPDWGGTRVGEDVQAFSDFLFFVLDTQGLLSELSVAVFDSVSGGVEIYRGKNYPGDGRVQEQRANMLMVRYEPGHYQALVPQSGHGAPTLPNLQERLDAYGIMYVVTDG